MRRDLFSYRTSAMLAGTLTVILHLFFGILVWFGHTFMVGEGMEDFRDHSRPDMGLEWFVVSITSVFVFLFLMFLINFGILKAELKRFRITILVLASLVGTVLITMLIVHIMVLIFDFEISDNYWRFVFGNMFKDFFLTLIVIFTSQILYLNQRKQQMALENEKLMAENMKSRYETLKSQVDPHFLFNTLNTLNTMIKIDVDRAQEYVQKMSSVFRYTLQNKEETSLEEELKFTHDYCLLMQIRYGESLVFDFDIDKQYNAYLIVPLSIQALVENAIKHNVISNRQPLTVSIRTTENDTLVVSNPIQVKKEAEPGEGIGLANLTERYRLHFQREPDVSCVDNNFIVTIPLIKPGINESNHNRRRTTCCPGPEIFGFGGRPRH